MESSDLRQRRITCNLGSGDQGIPHWVGCPVQMELVEVQVLFEGWPLAACFRGRYWQLPLRGCKPAQRPQFVPPSPSPTLRNSAQTSCYQRELTLWGWIAHREVRRPLCHWAPLKQTMVRYPRGTGEARVAQQQSLREFPGDWRPTCIPWQILCIAELDDQQAGSFTLSEPGQALIGLTWRKPCSTPGFMLLPKAK